MIVKLLNDGGHLCLQHLSFPIHVIGQNHANRNLIMVHENELRRVGGNGKHMTIDDLTEGMAYFTLNECQVVEPPCVRDKCCNQFGERDEIQGIIDALQADVKARDERIAELESRPTIEGYIDNMVNIQSEASLKGENGVAQMASFAVKTAKFYYCGER